MGGISGRELTRELPLEPSCHLFIYLFGQLFKYIIIICLQLLHPSLECELFKGSAIILFLVNGNCGTQQKFI